MHSKKRLFLSQPMGMAAGLALLGLAWATAQQAGPPGLPAPVLRVNTGLVLVNVVATDKDGNKVSGLSKEDIRLLEDGKEQDIAFLSLERISLDQSAPRPASLPQYVHTNRPEYRAPVGPPTIILLDILNTHSEHQRRARIELLKFVDQQLVNDRKLAVFSLGRTVKILQDFTDDPAQLRTAIESFTAIESVQLANENVPERVAPETGAKDAQNPLGRGVAGLQSDPFLRARDRAERFLDEQAVLALDDRIRDTVNAFRLISQWASGYPGRKNLLWVSAGMPKAKMSEVVNLQTGWSGQMRAERVYEEDIRRAISYLSDAQVTVYAVDARGLLASEGIEVGEVGMARELEGAKIDTLRTARDTRATLEMVANDTGGLFFVNRNDIGNSVAAGLEDGSHYYLLGYYPRNKKLDGKFHKIEIKSQREGIRFRHRRGYYARKPDEWKKVDEDKDIALLTAMQPGTPPAATVIFDTQMIPPQEFGKKAKIPVQFIVNADTLTYTGKEAGPRTVDVELRAICYRPDGEIAAHSEMAFKITITPEQIPSVRTNGLAFIDKMAVELERGIYTVAVAIRDNQSGNVGSAHFSLNVGSE